MKTCSRRPFWSCLLVVVGLTHLVPAEARSQEPPAPIADLTVGSRIRLLASPTVEGRLTGLLLEADDTSLLVSGKDPTPVRVPREAITRLEVSTGTHRHALTGMFIGAGVGAIVGAACYADAKNEENALVPCSSVLGAEIFGVLSVAGWGTLIGALIKSEGWSEVPLKRVRVSLAPTRGPGVGLSIWVAF